MCIMLLSINPVHVEKILEGTKKYEYRKVVSRKDVTKILIYSTTPVKKVIGEADVSNILIDAPENIWKKTKDCSGISKSFFDSYYNGKNLAVAYEIKNVRKYERSKNLSDYGIKTAPQSFLYLS